MTGEVQVLQTNEIPPMSREEAEQAVTTIIALGNTARFVLLEMFERKAHTALGYDRWEDFCEQRLGVVHSQSYHADLLRTARVERNVLGGNEIGGTSFTDSKYFAISDISDMAKYLTAVNSPRIPVQVAMQLSKLPTAELQKQAYSEMETLREGGFRTDKQYQSELGNIVKRLLPKTDEPKKTTRFEEDAKKHAPVTSGTKEDAKKPAAPAAPEAKEDEDDMPFASLSAPAAPAAPAAPTLNFTDATEALDTVYAWVNNEEIDGDTKTRMWVMAMLNEIAQWVEGQE